MSSKMFTHYPWHPWRQFLSLTVNCFLFAHCPWHPWHAHTRHGLPRVPRVNPYILLIQGIELEDVCKGRGSRGTCVFNNLARGRGRGRAWHYKNQILCIKKEAK